MKRQYILKKLNHMLGLLSESVVALHLSGKGFLLLHSRYKTPVMEIDLIACDAKHILFAEVKFRSSVYSINHYLDYQRCKKIYLAAECFLQDFPQLLSLIPLFKLFIITPDKMKVLDIF